jgi:glycosyltransferase involved in cell wall biosynthesis
MKMAQNDDRIRIIRQRNSGVSTARNKGLRAASGEYTCFVDADDYLDKEYVAYFCSLLESSGLDMAVGYRNYDYKKKNHCSRWAERDMSARQAIEDIYTGKLNVAVWNKMYRTKFLRDNRIFFDPVIWYGEGMLFNIVCLDKLDNVIASDRMVYHQTYNPNSAMRKFSLDSNLCGIRSLMIQKEIIDKKGKRVRRAWDYHLRCYNMSILRGIIKTGARTKYSEQFKKCVHGLRGKRRVVMLAPVALKTKLLYMLASFFPVRIATMLVEKEKRDVLASKC